MDNKTNSTLKNANEPLVSIIVPVYNVENYICGCIESVLNQRYKNYELILIDDGSTDKSGRICDEYSKNNMRIRVIHQENSGVSKARNNGLHNASGEYVAFLDSDDYYHIDYLDKMLREMQAQNCDIVCCNYTEIGKKYKKRNNIVRHTYVREEAIAHLLDYNGYKCYMWNKVFKAECVKDIFFPENQWFEDIVFCYDAFNKAQKIVYIEDGLYYYRVQNGYSSRFQFSYKNYDLLKSINYVLDNVSNSYSYQYIHVLMGYIVCYMSFLNRGYIANVDVKKYEYTVRNYIKTNKKNVIFTTAIPNKRKLMYILFAYIPLAYKFSVKMIASLTKKKD